MESTIVIGQTGNAGAAIENQKAAAAKKASSSGGGGGAASGITDKTFLASERDAKLAPIAEASNISLTSALSTDAQATALSNIISDANLRVFDNDGTFDRMGWESRFARPDRRMMTDNSGDGFLVTLNFANNLKADIDAGGGTSIGSHSIATARQAYEVGKYKLNRMWTGASTADRVAALKASSATPATLRQLGLNVVIPGQS